MLHNLTDDFVTGVDASATASRLSWMSSTSSLSARIGVNTFTATLNSFDGAAMNPAQHFVVGLLSCLDCAETDSAALVADDSLVASGQTLGTIRLIFVFMLYDYVSAQPFTHILLISLNLMNQFN